MSGWRKDRNFIATIVFGTAATVLAIWIPKEIDADAAERDRIRVCVDSAVDLREAMINLQGGYAASPDDHASRLRDWSAGKAAIDRIQASCWAVGAERRPPFEDVEPAFGQYACDYTIKIGGACDEPSVGVTGRSAGRSPEPIIMWTTGAIRRLTE